MLTKPMKPALVALGFVFGAISVFCSAMLWASFAQTWLDTVLAVTTATALVVASYVFVPVIVRAIELKKTKTAFIMTVLEAALVITSIAATVGWLESNYQANRQYEIQGSDSYQNNQEQIESLNADIKLLRASAAEDLKNNFRQRALETMDKVALLNIKVEALTNKPPTIQSQSSATALGNTFAENRWYFWTALAVLVDGCPLACFAIVSMRNPDKKNVFSQETLALINSDEVKETRQALHKLYEKNPLEAQKKILAKTSNAELKEAITKGIKAKRWGEKPAIRNVIADTKTRHEAVKPIFEQLVKEGILKMNGNRFERVA